MRDFKDGLKDSIKLNHEWKRVLPKLFKNCTVVFHDDLKTQKHGFDVTIDVSNRKYSADLKTKQFKYLKKTNLLEIIHHRYSDENRTRDSLINSKNGWLYESKAEYIIFGTLTPDNSKIIELCCFSLTPFKDESFKSNISTLKTGFAATKFNGTFQRTVFKIVPNHFLKEYANFYRHRIDPKYK